MQLKLSGFSWKRGISHFRSVDPRYHSLVLNERADLPTLTTYKLEPPNPTEG